MPDNKKPKYKGKANLKASTEEERINAEKSVADFYDQYLNSPKYRERLIKQGYTNPDEVISSRKHRLDKRQVYWTPNQGSTYDGYFQVTLDPNEIHSKGYSFPATVAHEFGHMVGAVPSSEYDGILKYKYMKPKEVNLINKSNKLFRKNKNYDLHEARPWEAKADVDALRYMLYKDNIYDAGQQDITPEILKKAREKYTTKEFKDLFTNFSDESLIEIMNTVAQTEQLNKLPMAKAGKKIKLDNGGPLKAKQNRPSKWEPPTNPTYKPLEAVTVTPPKMPTLDYSQPNFGETHDFGGRPDIMKETGSEQISTNYYQAMMDSIIPTKEPAGKKRNVNYGQLATMGLLAANALIPEDEPRRTVVQPQRGYNPNPYGTGSQAIFKAGGKMPDGGKIPPKKNVEPFPIYNFSGLQQTNSDDSAMYKLAFLDMLNNDPMALHKYYELQKYGTIPDPSNPQAYINRTNLLNAYEDANAWKENRVLVRPPDIKRKKKAAGGTPIPPVPSGDTYTNPTDSARDDIDMSELISTYIASGGIEEEGRKALFQRLSDKYGAKGAQDLFTEMSLFSQDAGNKSLAAPDKITRFFSLPSNANIKKDLNRFGYGAANIYDTASNVVAQKQQGRGLLTKMDAGGSLEKISPSTVEFVGKSHKKGGIDIAYAGQEVEVEGGETGTFSPDGTLNIMGNMKVMGTNKTFKQMSKSLARKENKYMSLMNKANDVSAGADTGAMIDRLKRNSAHLLSLGAEKGIADVHEKKEMLSEMQNAQLAMAEEGGYDPIAFSEGKKKKARKGMRIFAEPGASVGDPEKPKKKSVAQRHNNPGNIKWNPKLKWMEKLGAVKGEPATDGGYFAHFPDTNKGLTAIRELLKRGYGKYDVESGLKRWTGGTGYNLDLGGLKGKKIKDLSATELDSLVSTITYGEDGRYYSPEATPASTAAQEIITPTLPGLPNRTITNDVKTAAPQTSTVNPPPLGSVKNPQARSIESDIQPMSLEQVLPEIFALARNKVQSVAAQQYTPELLQDYEISLQDRRNENTSVFNAMQRTIGNNPAALSSLAGQLYGANNQVSAEEFRINQANENGIRNQNTEMLNQAEQLNLRLADEQYKRQSMAQSKTDAYNQMILNSISSKSLQHTANNRKLAIYENLYDFRYKDTNNDGIQDTATYEGPEHQYYSNGQAVESTPNRYADTTIIRDGQGNVRGSRVRVPSKARQEAQELDIQRKTNSVPFLRKLLRSI
jgi:hypothetical protein